VDFAVVSALTGQAFGSLFTTQLTSSFTTQTAIVTDPEALDSLGEGITVDYSTSVPPEQDPSLVQAARVIYETYYRVHPEMTDLPLGVAIDRATYRGKLIFHRKPILLPKESFIPLSSIDVR